MPLLASGSITAQDAVSAAPVYQVLSESTVQQKDGSSVTFLQVLPPVVSPQAKPPAAAFAVPLTAAQEAVLSQVPVQETQMLSISASVHADGFTVLHWTCGTSQRLHAVTNVDFRALAGLGQVKTEQTDYVLILSAGPDEQNLTPAEAQAAQLLPADGGTAFALVADTTAIGPADQSALDVMELLLAYYDAHKAELMQQQAQRATDQAARELAARNAPPPPPRHSIIHFWPLQPAQRAAIQENAQRQKGASQP
ncbi:hypothetical protein [Prosthecobacter vanneervenii]|uniref:Uncharacterized protein n=1 Tax=Prosthecobacter vanneervenii TaxID=48466 RepID=A0A7W7YB73_9BACT|nr:hypothetical protein [Prosthecobacter vanneervenii]MBB5032889.1 hypothetical protein [Prosthecobacter vanneervenii]